MKYFEFDRVFIVSGAFGRIVYSKIYGRGLLNGCQLVHVMMNDNPKDVAGIPLV